jgi:hypothetical protein
MTEFVFFIFKSAGEGEVVWGWLYLINSLQIKTQTATQLHGQIPSNSVLQLYSFDSGYSLVVLEGERRYKRGRNVTQFVWQPFSIEFQGFVKKKIKYIHQNLRYYETIEQIHFMVVKK